MRHTFMYIFFPSSTRLVEYINIYRGIQAYATFQQLAFCKEASNQSLNLIKIFLSFKLF